MMNYTIGYFLNCKGYWKYLIILIFLFSSCIKNEKQAKNDTLIYDKIILKGLDINGSYGRNATFKYLNKVSDSLNNPKLLQFQIKCLYVSIYRKAGILDSAKFFAADLMPLLNKIGSPDDFPNHYAQAYFYLSDVSMDSGDYIKAYKWLYEGRRIGAANFDNCTLSEFNYRIGMHLYKQEDYEDAVKCFSYSYQQSNDCKQRFETVYRIQEILSNVALCYYKVNKLDSSIYYYNKAFNYINTVKKIYPKQKLFFEAADGVIIGNLGLVYKNKKDYQKAIEFLTKSISINEHLSLERKDALLQKLNLAEIRAELKQTHKLSEILIDIENDVKLLNINSSKIFNKYFQIKANYEYLIGNSQAAYQYHLKSHEFFEKSKNEEKNLAKSNIYDQLNFLENKNNLDKLKKKDNLKTLYLIGAIVAIFMGIAVMLLIFNNWKTSKISVLNLKDLNHKVNQQSEELLVRNIEKDRILRVVAHDLRNPIGGISSIAQVIKEEGITDDTLYMVNLMGNASDDALTLIEEILELTNDKSTNVIFEKISATQLIINIISLIKFKIDEKNQTIIFKGLENDVEISINREKISRVINNLINNASKFSLPEKTIEISLSTQNEYLRVCIKDEGIGIPEEKWQHIFQQFSTYKRNGTLGEKSFGMGLFICKQIIETHHGKIWLNHADENGSEFCFELPIN